MYANISESGIATQPFLRPEQYKPSILLQGIHQNHILRQGHNDLLEQSKNGGQAKPLSFSRPLLLNLRKVIAPVKRDRSDVVTDDCGDSRRVYCSMPVESSWEMQGNSRTDRSAEDMEYCTQAGVAAVRWLFRRNGYETGLHEESDRRLNGSSMVVWDSKLSVKIAECLPATSIRLPPSQKHAPELYRKPTWPPLLSCLSHCVACLAIGTVLLQPTCVTDVVLCTP